MPTVELDLPADHRIRKILLIKWSALGDIVLASAAFEDVYRAFPGRELHLNVLPPWDCLFRHDPRFVKIITIDVRERGRGVSAMLGWLRAVRRERYDLIIDMQSVDRSRVLMTLLWLSGGGPRYAIGNRRRFPYHIGSRTDPAPMHALDRMRGGFKDAGIPVICARPVLHIAPRNRRRAQEILSASNVGDAYAVFLPGCQAAGHLKRWGHRGYAALALALRERGVAQILLLGADDERDECARIQAAAGESVVNLCGQTEIFDLIPVCEGARFIVANDTGTAHLAAATGRPMLVICGPTDPRRVKPAGDNVQTLQAAIYCVNCYRKECTHHACMTLISAEHVIQALRELSALPA